MSAKGKLLLIDDDQDDRYFFTVTLQATDNNLTCVATKSGADALKHLESEKNLPDIIFLDINMPEMSGWEVLKILKKDSQLKSIPVIMYSTSSHQRDVRIAEDSGALGFCTKPEDISELKKVLKFISDNYKSLSKTSFAAACIPAFKTLQN